MKKLLMLITTLLMFFMGASLYSQASGIPLEGMLLGLVGLSLVAALDKKVLKGVLKTDINVTEIIAEFGNYYIPGGQNMKRLMNLIRQGTVTPSFAQSILTKETKYRAAGGVVGEVIQAFQKQFTAKGNPKFLPQEYDLFKIKVDTEFYPDDVEGTWLGFLSNLDEPERKNWPIVRYIVEQLLIPKANDDLELDAYYHGVYSAPAPGVAGSASNAMDGIRTLFDPNKINDLPAIAIVQDNIVEQIESYIDKIPDKFGSTKMGVYMSPKMKMDYARDYRNTFGANVTYTERKAVEVDFAPNYEIIALPSMNGVKDVWITPQANFMHMRQSNKGKTPQVESAKRQVSVAMDWREGFAFGLQEMIWLHEEDGSGSGS